MLKELEENVGQVKTVYEQKGNTSKEKENLKNSGAKGCNKMRKPLVAFKGKIEQTEERSRQLKDRTMEIIESGKKNGLKKSLRNIKQINMHVARIPEEKKEAQNI